jgi:membrane protease YdiL (CAAX protease family)
MPQRYDSWATTASGALVTAVLFTLLALVEHTWAPWAPFYVLYAAACIALPLQLGAFAFGPLRAVRGWHWPAAVVLAVLLQGLAGGWLALWERVVLALGVSQADVGSPFWAFGPALEAMLDAAAGRSGLPAATVTLLYLGFIVLWAGLGEELFYRGYLYGALRTAWGVLPAALVSAFLFAIRHAVQLALVRPDYPWGAAASWVLLSFVVGIVLTALYQRTGSLWLPVAVHYLFNLIPLAGLLLAGPE